MRHTPSVPPAPRVSISPPLVVTVLCWGFNFVALKLIYAEGIGPAATSLSRFLVMGAILAMLCWASGQPLRYPKGSAPGLLLLGCLSMGVYMILFLEGMARTSPAEGAIILASAPVMTALLAVLVRQEPFSWGAIAGAMLAFSGVGLVVWTGGASAHGTLLGNLLILASAFVWAGCAVLSKTLVTHHSPITVLTLGLPGALPLLLIYGLVPTLEAPWGVMTAMGWAMFAHIVILAGIVGFIGFYAGVRQVGSAGAMLYQFCVPPIAALFAWLLLGDAFLPLQAVGLGVVIAGIWWSSRSRMAAALRTEECSPPVPTLTEPHRVK